MTAENGLSSAAMHETGPTRENGYIGGSVSKTYDELYERLDETVGDLVYIGASELEIKTRVEDFIDEAMARKDQAIIDRYEEEK